MLIASVSANFRRNRRKITSQEEIPDKRSSPINNTPNEEELPCPHLN